MSWDKFYIFAFCALAFWIVGAIFAFVNKKKSRVAIIMSLVGIVVFSVFIILFWINLQRPPLRTMGETRLWYSFFLSVSGLITYCVWRYRWIMSFSTIMAAVFIFINIFNPEIHDRVLMPALQSAWFVPHVTIYIFSYALLGCTFLLAIVGLFSKKNNLLSAIDNLTLAGFAFFSVGMLLGALWAKQAWGDFWTWDAKETWGAITWLGYLFYIHLRQMHFERKKILYLCIILCFCALQMCWYGVNYLPTAKQSAHTYTMNN